MRDGNVGSQDGTKIRFLAHGQGRPLVVVPGTLVRTAFAVSGSPTARDEGPAETTLAQLAHLVPGLMVDLECTTEMTIAAALTS